jgi:cysteine synthase A
MSCDDQLLAALNTIGSRIGKTPLVRLSSSSRRYGANIYAKLELHNPAGSIKDRTAFSLLSDAVRRGRVSRGTTVVESSSGNLAIALAWICSQVRLKFVAVIDPSIAPAALARLHGLGATIDRVTRVDDLSGTYLPTRIARARTLGQKPEHCWLDQYSNPANPRAHQETARELFSHLSAIDIVIVPVSTCGAARGISDYMKLHASPADLVLVDSVGSRITGSVAGVRKIPGFGAAIAPPHFQHISANRIYRMSDLQCVAGCRQLLQCEELFLGGSSGAAYVAASQEALRSRGANIVFVAPDSGSSYANTVYNLQWVLQELGTIDEALEPLNHAGTLH